MAESESPSVPLVRLQALDTEIDQLAHRRDRLPESEVAAAAASELSAWQAERDALRARIEQLGVAISDAEARTAELGEHTARLEAQMKTVIAPREAEALMNEIAGLADERDRVETAELEALEAQTELEDRLGAHLAGEDALRAGHDAAAASAADAVAEVDRELASLRAGRDEARPIVDTALLTRYDRIREHHVVAVSRLDGRQCSGCHLELSAAEVDDVKDEATAGGGVATCPQCGRMLVV